MTRGSQAPPSGSLPTSMAKVWILGPVIRTYTCVYTIFCSGLLPRRPQCSGTRQVFSYLIDPSSGQGSDKRLIFLRANDLRIPDVLHLLSPLFPPLPFHSADQFRFFCLFPLLRISLFTSTYRKTAQSPETLASRSRHRVERASNIPVLWKSLCTSFSPSPPSKAKLTLREIKLTAHLFSATGPPTVQEWRIFSSPVEDPPRGVGLAAFFTVTHFFAEFGKDTKDKNTKFRWNMYICISLA